MDSGRFASFSKWGFWLFVASMSLTVSSPLKAFNLNPLDQKYHQHDPGILAWARTPVHENLTRESRERYWAICLAESQAGEMPAGCEAKHSLPGGMKNDALVRGVWYPDDPNQWLFDYHYPRWVLDFSNAGSIAKTKKQWITKKSRKEIGPGYRMEYRSHYGDMQFLHAMASKDEVAAVDTQAEILTWAKFIYAGTQGVYTEHTKFRELDMADVLKWFPRQIQYDSEIWSVLAPSYTIEDFKSYNIGIILHMIQDSFAAGHTTRNYESSKECPTGRVVSFNAYTHQDTDKHSAADKAEGAAASNFTKELNPVDAGAQIIRMARRGDDWETKVMPYLKNTVFCIGPDAAISGPGAF